MMLREGPSCGHDFDFHLVSWMETARAWHAHILYPHWIQSANYGAGEPRLVFYPPGSWIIGALFGASLGWHAAPFCFTLLCLLFSGWSMRRFALRWLPPTGATIAGCLYLANPYSLFVAYERTAYGELLAASLIPSLLACAVAARPKVTRLSLIIAALWLTNAPSAVIACYALLWIGVVRVLWTRRWGASLRLGLATVTGTALAGFYVVAAAREQRWVEIARAIGAGMRYQDSFLFGHTGDAYHDTVLRTASIISCLLLVIAAASFLFSPTAVAASRRSKDASLAWLLTLVPLILLLLVPISAPIWHTAPHLAFVQFPWRWLMILAPLAAFALALALNARVPEPMMLVCGLGVAALSIAILTPRYHQTCDDQDNITAQVELMKSGDGQEGTDEYTPRDADNAEIAQDQPEIRVLRSPTAEEPDSSRQENPEWRRDDQAEIEASINTLVLRPEHWQVRIDSPVAGYALFRLLNYPAWRVRRNDMLLTGLPRRDDGLLVVPLPAGRSLIEIDWRTTADVWWGRALSLVGCIMLCGVWRFETSAKELSP